VQSPAAEGDQSWARIDNPIPIVGNHHAIAHHDICRHHMDMVALRVSSPRALDPRLLDFAWGLLGLGLGLGLGLDLGLGLGARFLTLQFLETRLNLVLENNSHSFK